jgi:prefoldin subunit 5
MEAQIVKHNEGIKVKIPDIEKAIEAVQYMEKKNAEKTSEEQKNNLNVDFMVSNNLWAKAEVPIGETVCLWLGADIMCEYAFDEAKALLTKNLNNAVTTLANNENDLDYIKDQITVCEVSKKKFFNN